MDQVKQAHPDYHAAPVAPFGKLDARLLIVGLAPGMHGANATGRPFTGDAAGILLYETLHRHGYANQPQAKHADDGLGLIDCRITNAVKCLPPENKPVAAEVNRCSPFLQAELDATPPGAVILALGTIAHKAVCKALDLRPGAHPFAHGAEYDLADERKLIASYHCSRYNTQTKRLTPAMFDAVFLRIKALLDADEQQTAAV